MRVYDGKDVRNVAIAGHGHSGKTQLTAAMLYTAGVTNRLTKVDEGNTLTDFDEEEIDRKITIHTAIAAVEWNNTKINFLDTPGFNIFMNDTHGALHVADGALIVVDAVSGVEVQTEKVWNFAEEFHEGHAVVINKLDRENASFERTVESLHEAFGKICVPIHLPIGEEKDFRGIIDLISMKAYLYTPGGDGKGKETEIPAHLKDAAKAAHDVLVEAVASGKDELMEEFFEDGTLPEEHVIAGLHEELAADTIVPILCASGTENIGTDRLLDFCVRFMPSAIERYSHVLQSEDGDMERPIGNQEPVAAFVFKTSVDPFQGRLSFFKVLSGVVKSDAHLLSSRSNTDERLSHIGISVGKSIHAVNEIRAGDIGVVPKLKDTLTTDTLAEKGSRVSFCPLKLDEPSIAYAIEAKSRNDEDRMATAIHKVLEEDPSLRFYRDPQTNEFLLAGAGQQHIEIVVSRLRRKYGVDVTLHAPKVPYRETIRGTADVQGRHKKQTGGHGQFGDVRVRIEPLPRGANFEFENAVFGGSVPKNFIPAVEKGFVEAAANGYLAGYPMVDFKVVLYDGSYHDVDSSEMSFKMAARKAFKAAMSMAKPALLEPIMNVEIHTPVEYAGDLMGDLNSRRGRISGMDIKGNTQIIRAQVPMAEMLTYQSDLTSITQGRASFAMEFDHYDYVPQLQTDKIVAASAGRVMNSEDD